MKSDNAQFRVPIKGFVKVYSAHGRSSLGAEHAQSVRTTVGSGPAWIISQAYDHVVLALEPCTVLEQTGCSQVWRQTELQSSVSYPTTKTRKISQYFPNAFLVLIARGVHLQQIYVRYPKPITEQAYKGIIMSCVYQNMSETVSYKTCSL